MTKISKLRSHIRVLDAANIGARIYELLLQQRLEDVHINTLQSSLDQTNQKLAAVIKENKERSLLDEADIKRDTTYRSLLYLNKSYLLHPNATIRESAAAVEQVLEPFSFDLTSMNYAAQSEALQVIFRELNAPALTTKVALLPSMPEVLQQLISDEQSFMANQKQWLEARAEDDKTHSATAYKRELVHLVNEQLVVYLRAMMQLNPEPFSELSTKVAILINEANYLIKSRQKSSEEVEV